MTARNSGARRVSAGLRATAPLTVVLLGLWFARSTSAQQVQPLRFNVSGLSFPVQNISFPVQGFGFRIDDITAPAEESSKEVRFRLSADLLFDFDQADLRPEAVRALEELAERIRSEFPDAPVRVEGHTDAKGSDAYNQALSERRAESVKQWLVERGGFSSERIIAKGFGESQRAAPNQGPDGSDDPAGRQQNRRVEIVVERRGAER